jgi:hypothetical protein
MSSIGQFTFDAWNGRIMPQEGQYEKFKRSGLAGYGVGFDADMVEDAFITTRVIIPYGTEANLYAQYRALERSNVTVVDGFGTTWRNALILKVRGAQLDLPISPPNSTMLTVQWLILPDIV